MGVTASILDDILTETSPSEEILEAVRARRDKVLGIVRTYPGALRTFTSGSVAHRTANEDTDADGGVVLDRRSYPDLGPDGHNEGPEDIVDDVRKDLRVALKEEYSNVAFWLSKRAIRVTFNEPLADGTDPTVDLIIALTRKDGALWIPNLHQNRWDASDPEYHTALMTAEPAALRRTRAKVVRLTKAWNKQFTKPGLCSFNITALALACITEGIGVARGLSEFFHYAASDLEKRLTPDPAGVSPAIKLLIERDIAVKRLRHGAKRMDEALDHDDDEEAVLEALSSVFGHYVSPPAGSTSKAAFANALRAGNNGVGVSHGLVLGAPAAIPIKTTRSFGSGRSRM